MSTSAATAPRLHLAIIAKVALVGGIIAAFTSDFELYRTTLYPMHGSLADAYRYITDTAFGGAAAPGNPVVLGLLAHVLISIGWAYGYVDLAGRTPALQRMPWLSGTVFGIVVLTAMQCILLSVHRFHTLEPTAFVNLVVMHTLFFGIPIALVTRRMLAPPRT